MANHLEINITKSSIENLLQKGDDPVKFYTDLVAKEVAEMMNTINNEQKIG